MGRKVKSVTDIVSSRLCLGCGACYYACPQGKIELFDFVGEGIRPQIEGDSCGSCTECAEVCPGVITDLTGPCSTGQLEGVAREEWGTVLELWEGYATDPVIRFRGSSGGVLTALGAYLIEEGGMHGVLHIAQDREDPMRNRTQLSRSRESLLAATGSRYSPASVCNGLNLVESAPGPCAIVGKPSEIAALRKVQARNPALDEKVGLAMSFFCAETPPTLATKELLGKMGVHSGELKDLRYRGMGWPGHFAPTRKGDKEPAAQMTYQESWAFLQAFRPWATHLWPDGSGELADISCGDPWYEDPDGENPGFSLVAVRTERGREILRGAMERGYLTLNKAEAWKLGKSQANLLKKKGSVQGRIWALALLGASRPKFSGANLSRCWRALPLREKVRSTIGTIRRFFRRRLWRPLLLDSREATPVRPAIDSES